MKKKYLRELMFLFIALAGSLILIYVTAYVLDNDFDDKLVVNEGETYYVMTLHQWLMPFVLVLLYLTYGTRFFASRYRNQVVNGVFSLISLYLIIVFPRALQFVTEAAIPPGRVIYPPLGPPSYDTPGNLFYAFSKLLPAVFVFVIVLFGFTLFQTGRRSVLTEG
ncbi:MAG TPA: hypothetical protein VK183_05555 [Flavobacterium sp.]|nr:hypothetical protein [Flavobacterium sp.]